MKSSTISLAFEVSNGLLELFLLLTEGIVFPNYASLLFQHFSLFTVRDDVIILDFRIVFKVLENHRTKKQVTVFFLEISGSRFLLINRSTSYKPASFVLRVRDN